MMNLTQIFSKIFQKDKLPGNKREALLRKIKKAGFPNKEVLISLTDFFDGNEDDGSIGANIYPNPPSLVEFYDILTAIEVDKRTDTILIRIADVDDGDWFYTDTVYIAGDYSLTEIKKLFKKLKPDEIYEGYMYNGLSNIPTPKPNSKGYSIWWD